MAQPFVGEIRMFAGNFNPSGWMFCDGTPMPISENEVLFQLIGTTFGGDGESTFNLPDLRGRVPVHANGQYIVGENGGVEQVTLTVNQMPSHTHAFLASTKTGTQISPDNEVLGSLQAVKIYRTGVAAAPMAPQAVTPVGGSQPHDNMQPYLGVNFIISLFGLFPTPT